MTRHGQTDPVVALSLRRPTRPCGPGTGMESIVPEIAGMIDKVARHIRSAIDLIGRPRTAIDLAHNPRPNTPKHKSP